MNFLSHRYARFGLVGIAAAAIVASGQSTSFGAQQAAKKLAGEKLASAKGTGGSSSKCKASSGSFTFTVSGSAKGPYPGRFTATGAVALSKYRVTRYTATVHITSKQSRVSITESLAKSATDKGFCLRGYGLAAIAVKYRASVVVSGHTSRQSGAIASAVAGGSAKTSTLRQLITGG